MYQRRLNHIESEYDVQTDHSFQLKGIIYSYKSMTKKVAVTSEKIAKLILK